MEEQALTGLAALAAFRRALHGCFVHRRDALFELVEGLLTGSDAAAGAGPASVARLSLAPSHRRGWGSAYAALRRCGAANWTATPCGRCSHAGLRHRRPGRTTSRWT